MQVHAWKWVVGDGAGVIDRKPHITSLLFRYGSWTSKARQTIKELKHQKKNSYIYIPIYSSQLWFPFFPKWTYMFEMTHKNIIYIILSLSTDYPSHFKFPILFGVWSSRFLHFKKSRFTCIFSSGSWNIDGYCARE